MIKIEKPSPSDAYGMCEVKQKTWIATYPNKEYSVTLGDILDRTKNSLSEESVQRMQRNIENEEKNEKILVAKDGKKVVGICLGVIYENKNQLQAIYILPEYQGQGIGTLFWKELLPFFDKEKDIFVEVVEYNTKAIGFYEKLGFKDTGRRFKDERFRLKSGVILPEMEMVFMRNWS